MTKVWINKNFSSDGNNQSDFWTPNSNSNSRADSNLNNDNDLRNEERSENQDDSSNVKMSNQHNKRKHKQWRIR